MISESRLDDLWDFEDGAASEARFRAELDGDLSSADRAVLTTQLARAIGLQGKFDEASAMLIEVDPGDDAAIVVRVLLESGRLMNSSGHPDDAATLFRQATAVAERAGAEFLAIDALHMLGIVDLPGTEDWTARAVELAEGSADPRTQRWMVSLHSNLGWVRLEAGEPDAALAEFVEASRWADLVGTPEQRQWALEAIAECTAAIESPPE